MIFGFTGTFASGKGTAIEFLAKKYGAQAYSLSDEVREECRTRGLSVERPNLVKVGNEMREMHGAGYFARKVADKIKEDAKYPNSLFLVDSIRLPGEVEALREEFGGNFKLVAVDAPIEVRYERIKRRARAGEHLLSFAEFKKSEGIENSRTRWEQNISGAMAMADCTVVNDSTPRELEKKAAAILHQFCYSEQRK